MVGMEITVPNASVREEIEEAYARYADALARHDSAALASFYDEDAVLLAPGAAPVAGAEAIRAYCDGLCALPYNFELSGFSIEHLLLAGEYIIECSRFLSSSWPPGEPQFAVSTPTKNLVVWRRRGATWLIVRDMYSDVKE